MAAWRSACGNLLCAHDVMANASNLQTAGRSSALVGARCWITGKTTVRGRDGQLVEIQAVWIAEAERFDGTMDVASATASNALEAWATLRDDIDSSRYRSLSRIRLLGR